LSLRDGKIARAARQLAGRPGVTMDHDDSDIERALLRYRPVEPPPGMRGRVLREEAAIPVRRWPLFAFRAAVAATLLVSLGLWRAAEHLNQATAAQSGLNQVPWNADA